MIFLRKAKAAGSRSQGGGRTGTAHGSESILISCPAVLCHVPLISLRKVYVVSGKLVDGVMVWQRDG
ncbi:uncharacterized protein SETTUDRAFT_168439 [Exserohilum turcica Et28A]|uniref:Uncharacterized protein n=1 Tax=Exserohilum turcicum (strain 28A) TaxID=671987 RepID=R0K6I1_EXST2|nr:uncharacterized protein SETTUDRAFT_168439 [Exserohilum turcica Et28A]EOA88603.1 hypothetical protein SETTUDRAFT_168439 [Exserohilum turcica Et28A]